MEPVPEGRQIRSHLRDSTIDEFQGSDPTCKGFKGHPTQAAQKMIEWEKIPEQGIRTEVLPYILNNSRSIGNPQTSQLLSSPRSCEHHLGSKRA